MALFFVGLAFAAPAPEGDANPDPKANPLMYMYGGYPYYSSYYYPYSMIGKRSADAEPEANADPKANPLMYMYGYPYSYYSYPYYMLGK